jgi:hypothetical protein
MTGNGLAVARSGGVAWSEQGSTGASDTWALADSGREREMRGAGVRGPAREKQEWAEPG